MTSIDKPAGQTPDTGLLAAMLIESLQKGESPALTVISNSMSPLLERNDQVMLVSADLETLKKGDIITVKSEEGFLTHRVVSRSNREIRTKGDRNSTLDPPYHPDQIIGRVQKIKSKRFNKIINLDVGWDKIIGKLIYRLSILEFFLINLFKINHGQPLDSFSRRLFFKVRLNQRNYRRVIPVTFAAVMRLLMKTL